MSWISSAIPAMGVKYIKFRRLANRACTGYQIYAVYKDPTYTSGKRTELLDEFPNPSQPETLIMKTIDLDYSQDATWKLPPDIFLDKDHQFRLYMDGFIVSSMHYTYNRAKKLVTLDTVSKPYDLSNHMTMEYFVDLLERSYAVDDDDCTIYVKPVFSPNYTYGTHNVII